MAGGCSETAGRDDIFETLLVIKSDEKRFRACTHTGKTNTRLAAARCGSSSFIRTVTVGPGVSPDLLTLRLQALAGYTAGGEFHPALKTYAKSGFILLPLPYSAKLNGHIIRADAYKWAWSAICSCDGFGREGEKRFC
jgi:hypothetical protein